MRSILLAGRNGRLCLARGAGGASSAGSRRKSAPQNNIAELERERRSVCAARRGLYAFICAASRRQHHLSSGDGIAWRAAWRVAVSWRQQQTCRGENVSAWRKQRAA